MILSQILRGLADTFSPARLDLRRPTWSPGLRRAADAAYEAVLRPVEGTILTVVRLAAEVGRAGVRRAAKPPSTTCSNGPRTRRAPRSPAPPTSCPVLRDAGRGRRRRARVRAAARRVPQRRGRAPGAGAGGRVDAGRGRRAPARAATARGDIAELRYEVMYFLARRRRHDPDSSRSTWGALGDSIVVVGGDGIWNCHVHTNDIGAAIEAGIVAGRPAEIRVTDLLEQVEEREEAAWVREQTDGRRSARDRRARRHRRRRGRGGRRPRAAASPASACSTSSPVGSR